MKNIVKVKEDKIETVPEYGTSEYWEVRYQRDTEQFDWLQRYYTPTQTHFYMKDIITQAINQPKANILVVGCGTSRMSEELFDDGFLNVQSIDISYSAIKLMEDLYQERPKLVFKQMDVRNLKYKDGVFDCVIDKACLDALVCGPKNTVSQALNEIYRVLSPTGKYITISHAIEN